MTQQTIALEVFRYRPEEEHEPTFQTYEVPLKKEWVVLDALNYIKDEIDGTLTFRWSCRMGVCGSCGMMINGTPVLTCAAFLETYQPGPVRIEPLANFPVVRDLVILMSDFMEKLGRVKPWIITEKEKPVAEGEYLQTPTQLADFKQYSMCINCMLCYSACPVSGLEPDFIGPAAIALAQRYNLDSRDEGSAQRMEILSQDDGIWQCTLVGECSAVCPKGVDPAGAIQRYKVASTNDWWRSKLMPWGK
ncbi:MAG: succinate dehydrogenase/fumarate reductase iron-sulfur subunit [Myxococcales bacterium]|nr:succinate dehydrogenase/fumarate reductase iron-sulfur subunit [Myxococcales bacterium]MDH3845953.1 succinate dehydrogenase/fumarate reductase iron-sulfur subunit [Myxococcales bacterium]